jgi:predicted house-cleaning noncanonical NTP pyrophosphatase (MazG superfamily)
MRKKVVHNKLVRDRIPDILREKGIEFESRQLSEDEIKKSLIAKLQEEVKELVKEYPNGNCTEEIADIWEVVLSLQSALGLKVADIVELMDRKRETNGGFLGRTFLVSTTEEVPDIKLEGMHNLFMHTRGKVRRFEVVLSFSDGSRRRWDLTLEQLQELGATEVKTLNHMRKLKDWIMGAGKAWFEAQVNKEDIHK